MNVNVQPRIESKQYKKRIDNCRTGFNPKKVVPSKVKVKIALFRILKESTSWFRYIDALCCIKSLGVCVLHKIYCI